MDISLTSWVRVDLTEGYMISLPFSGISLWLIFPIKLSPVQKAFWLIAFLFLYAIMFALVDVHFSRTKNKLVIMLASKLGLPDLKFIFWLPSTGVLESFYWHQLRLTTWQPSKKSISALFLKALSLSEIRPIFHQSMKKRLLKRIYTSLRKEEKILAKDKALFITGMAEGYERK